MLKLDHFALGTNDLDKATQALSEQLGVLPFGGGEHDLFGTHNKLWRIETPKYPVYMELIAANPAATPKRPRWFGLEKMFDHEGIELLGFVASTPDIGRDVDHAPFAQLTPIDVARGELHWKFGITDTGSLLGDGALPYLIEWSGDRHPLDGVSEQKLTLVKFEGNALEGLDAEWPLDVSSVETHKLQVDLINTRGELVQFVRR